MKKATNILLYASLGLTSLAILLSSLSNEWFELIVFIPPSAIPFILLWFVNRKSPSRKSSDIIFLISAILISLGAIIVSYFYFIYPLFSFVVLLLQCLVALIGGIAGFITSRGKKPGDTAAA